MDRTSSNVPTQPDSAQHPANRRALRAQRMEQTVELYAGALPHPDHLERFEAILPGASDRFLGLAERQSQHRQGMERKYLNFNGTTQILGSIFAGLTVLGGLGGGVFLIYNDKPVSGFVALLTPLSVVGGIFLRTRKAQAAEIARKR